jgi:hypothetical protein
MQWLDESLQNYQVTTDDGELPSLSLPPHGFKQRAVGFDTLHAIDEPTGIELD